MIILDNNATVRIFNSVTGKTEKLIQGELDMVNHKGSITMNMTNTVELENDNLNVHEEEKNVKLDSLQKLLDENKHYYVNRHCFGEYYGEDKIESYNCDQCGDWNGSWSDGTFKELFLGDITSQLEYGIGDVIEELEMKDLFEIDEFDNYNLKDKSIIEMVLDKLTSRESLYVENVSFTVEDEHFSISMSDIHKEYIKEALMQLISRVEE